jgi:hypothetical protein
MTTEEDLGEMLEMCFQLIKEELSPEYDVTFRSDIGQKRFILTFLGTNGYAVEGVLGARLQYRPVEPPEFRVLTADLEEYVVDLMDPNFGVGLRKLLADPLGVFEAMK